MAPAAKYSSQEQLDKVLDAAVTCIENSSLLDFKMSEISKISELSMGTVYKHIKTKEDVLVALAAKIEKQCDIIADKIFDMPLTMPEKLMAFQLIDPKFFYVYSFGAQLSMLVANQSVLSRASAYWTSQLMDSSQKTASVFVGRLQEAIDEGELTSSGCDKDLIAEIVVGLWSISVGYMLAAQQQETFLQQHHLFSKPMTLPPLPTDHICSSNLKLINAYQWREPLQESRLEGICQLLAHRKMR